MPRRERIINWRIVIDDGHGFPHAYRVQASDHLSVHMVYLILRMGLRLLGVGANITDLGSYLGQTYPIKLKKAGGRDGRAGKAAS